MSSCPGSPTWRRWRRWRSRRCSRTCWTTQRMSSSGWEERGTSATGGSGAGSGRAGGSGSATTAHSGRRGKFNRSVLFPQFLVNFWNYAAFMTQIQPSPAVILENFIWTILWTTFGEKDTIFDEFFVSFLVVQLILFCWISPHPLTSSYWAETEPNYEGKCLSVFWRQRNRKWVANKCSLDFGAVCELEISP